MTPLRRALDRAGRPSTPRELGSHLLILGVLAVVRGALPMLVPGKVLFVRANVNLGFWIMYFLTHALLMPLILRRWVHPVEGRRPKHGLPFSWREIQLDRRTVGGLVAVVCLFLALIADPIWFVAAACAASVAIGSPWFALCGVGASWFPHTENHRLDVACLAMGLACATDGVLRWWRPSSSGPVPEPSSALEGDLLRLLSVTQGADPLWLERSSGLDAADEVQEGLNRLREKGWIAEQVASDGPVVTLTRKAEMELYVTQGWRPPAAPL